MTTINKIKIGTITSFLLIVFPGKLTLINLLFMIVGFVASLMDLMCEECNQIEPLKNLVIFISVLISFILIFSKRKLFVLGCVIMQVLYLCYTFKVDYLKYWYYILPTLVYLLLCLLLIFRLFFKSQNFNK